MTLYDTVIGENGKTLSGGERQRLSIACCDKIVVLKEGQLVETGTHSELIGQPGLYQRLYALQNESMEWTVGCYPDNRIKEWF